jgi:uncharacterized protein YkwD
VTAVLGLGALDGGSVALGATASTHARAHRATRCGRSARSVKARSRTKRHGRISCAKHHSKVVKHSTSTKPGAGSRALSTSAENGAGGCANAALAPTTQNLELIRAATLCLVNRERAAHGDAPLVANSHLQQSAQGHTTSMVVDDYFEHVGPGGQTPLQRMREAGYISGSHSFQVGENIAWGTLWLGTPRSIVAAWMASPEHRANILDGHFRDTGIGVSSHPPRALGGGMTGGIYTQDFGVVAGG